MKKEAFEIGTVIVSTAVSFIAGIVIATEKEKIVENNDEVNIAIKCVINKYNRKCKENPEMKEQFKEEAVTSIVVQLRGYYVKKSQFRMLKEAGLIDESIKTFKQLIKIVDEKGVNDENE